MAVNVVLLGMMGAGKTSVGEKLSQLTGRRLIDTDHVIERRHGKIAEIFGRFGETRFREIETALCRELSQEDGLIVSTGGGTLLCEENRELLKEKGVLVYLRANAETLASRIGGGDERPLLSGSENRAMRIKELFAVRAPVYEGAADLIVDTDGKSAQETAEEIVRLVERGKK